MPTPVKVPIPSDNSNRVEQQSAAALVDGTLVWAKQGRAGYWPLVYTWVPLEVRVGALWWC